MSYLITSDFLNVERIRPKMSIPITVNLYEIIKKLRDFSLHHHALARSGTHQHLSNG
jgi:hypothetical protein